MSPAILSRLDELAGLCARHRVRRLALFGSAAKGSFDPATGSDIDLLVDFQPMSPRELVDNYFGFLKDCERLLGVPVDLVESGAVRNPYFRDSISASQRVLFEVA